MILICVFLMVSDAKHLFMCLFTVCVFALLSYLLKCFLIELFSYCRILRVVCIFYMSVLYDKQLENVFFQFVAYFPLNIVFNRPMLFIWMSTQLQIKKNRLCFQCTIFQYKIRILKNSIGKMHVIANKHFSVQFSYSADSL